MVWFNPREIETGSSRWVIGKKRSHKLNDEIQPALITYIASKRQSGQTEKCQ